MIENKTIAKIDGIPHNVTRKIVMIFIGIITLRGKANSL